MVPDVVGGRLARFTLFQASVEIHAQMFCFVYSVLSFVFAGRESLDRAEENERATRARA